jgi:hypothetical protein
MVRSVREVARYTNIHIEYNILISGKLQYPANIWPRRYWVSQVVLYPLFRESAVSILALEEEGTDTGYRGQELELQASRWLVSKVPDCQNTGSSFSRKWIAV